MSTTHVVGLPTDLAIDAHVGDAAPVGSPVDPDLALLFALKMNPVQTKPTLAPQPKAELKDWKDPRVGWTLILPTVPDWSNAQLAIPSDQPACIQVLWEERGKPDVLRYDPAWPNRHSLIQKPAIGAPVSLAGAPRGLAKDALPFYLLIVGGPHIVPWDVQIVLNESRAVGRLALTGVALDRYAEFMRAGWPNAESDIHSPLVWAVDHGPADITDLMWSALAKPVYGTYAKDKDLTGTVLVGGKGESATASQLVKALEKKPGIVVTSSHGQTTPLDDPAELRRGLGWLVDSNHHPIDPATLLAGWEPDGAIWYAHACCSAGSQSPSQFAGLFADDSSIGRVLKGVADAGPQVAPLPQALLSAEKPARAFVGHLEPTFNWSLQHPQNRQYLTWALQNSLYQEIYTGVPVGLAFREHFETILGHSSTYDQNRFLYNNAPAPGLDALLLYGQLAMRDIRNMVVLGDPTVALPKL